MTALPPAISRQNEIAQIIADAEVELRPIVKRIFWDIEPDWSGDWAITLRVVLSNNAARGKNLFKNGKNVERHLREKLQPDNLGLIAYFRFRSEAEQIELGKKAWK
jgi:hypothetical protein